MCFLPPLVLQALALCLLDLLCTHSIKEKVICSMTATTVVRFLPIISLRGTIVNAMQQVIVM